MGHVFAVLMYEHYQLNSHRHIVYLISSVSLAARSCFRSGPVSQYVPVVRLSLLISTTSCFYLNHHNLPLFLDFLHGGWMSFSAVEADWEEEQRACFIANI